MWEVPKRYQSLSPVGSGAYGSVWYGILLFFLQNIYGEHCRTSERLSLPTEACRSYQKTDPLSICQKYRRKKTEIQLLLICTFTELVIFRVEDPSASAAFHVWVGISFVFFPICFATLLGL